MASQQFDVFLAHSDRDKPLIRRIYRNLQNLGLRPWLDEEEIAPGASFQDEIQRAIRRVSTAAICIGSEGLGQWQEIELKALISECIDREVRVIPLLLPGVLSIPERLAFLRQYNYVAFQDAEDEQALYRLEWGITGKKPVRNIVEIAPTITSLNQRDVESIRGLGNLESFLSSAQWKKADKQTKAIILEGSNGDRLMAPAIRDLSLDSLHSIDHLWAQYSDGRFGLKVQLQIWQQCFEPRRSWINPFAQGIVFTDAEAWNQLGLLVGWRDEDKKVLPDSKVNFSIEAPIGCFPQTRRWLHGGYGNAVKQFAALMERILELK